MSKCDVCGNDYDKAFTLRQGEREASSTASNAPYMPSRRNAPTAAAGSSAMAWKATGGSSAAPIAPAGWV